MELDLGVVEPTAPQVPGEMVTGPVSPLSVFVPGLASVRLVSWDPGKCRSVPALLRDASVEVLETGVLGESELSGGAVLGICLSEMVWGLLSSLPGGDGET